MTTSAASLPHHKHDDIVYPGTIPFILIHLSVFAAFWTGVNMVDIWICLALYWIRIWGITAGYHRYFSHRTYKTSRWFQFVLAFVGGASAQKGAIWWASIHRRHHKYSDTAYDVHSPRQHGFLYAHVGWIFAERNDSDELDLSNVGDLTQYPELMFLNKYQHLPAILVGTAVWFFAGWSGLVIGFLLSTVLTWHGTFFINSMAHVHGNQRYVTGDDSRNNWWLALITLGEGWHNNHHYYQSCARQGFRWWEIDVSYYSIKLLQWMGIVWEVKEPSAEVIAGDRRLPGPISARAKEIYAAMAESVDGFADKGRGVLDTAGSRWDHFTETGKVAVREAMIQVSQRFDEVSEGVSEKVEPVRVAAREAMAQASEAAGHARNQAREVLETTAEALDPNKAAYDVD